ncbi:MAG: hypothetical protein KDA65_09110 [Planctomycetaceae bacterium]|nr:hypothetical protein [Planctomycetaceae bacterium]
MNTFAALTPYSGYLDILSRDIPGVLWKVALLLVLGLLFVASGVFLPALLYKKKSESEQSETEESSHGFSVVSFLSLSLIGGIANCLLWWILSYHLTKSFWPGMIATLPLTAWGIFKVSRNCPCNWKSTQQTPFIVVTLIALLIGIWHHGVVGNQIALQGKPDAPPEQMIVFNDRQSDVSFHVLCSTLIQEYGLPRIDPFGTYNEKYMPLGHVGYSTLIAGCSELTRQDPYCITSALWILTYLMLGWLALCCVEQYQLNSDVAIVAGITPLLWGQLGVPNLRLLITPSTIPNLQGLESKLAGDQFHNIPQSWSMVFGLAFLFCFQQYQQSGRSYRWWLAGILSLIVSGWVKPSLLILLGPALIICMIVNRNNLREWLSLVISMALGMLVYCLSALMADLPSGNKWFFTLTHERFLSEIIEYQWIPSLTYFGLGLGVGLIYLVLRLKTAFPDIKARHELNWADLSLIAVLGSLLFALLFRELSGDIVFNENQPNIRWGISASISILSCFIVVCLAKEKYWRDQLQLPGWLRVCAIVLVGVHLFNGLIYAAVYPLSTPRLAFMKSKEVFLDVHAQSDLDDRFLVDPKLMDEFVFDLNKNNQLYDLNAYLQRPLAMNLCLKSIEELRIVEAWHVFCNTTEPEHLGELIGYLNHRNALIIHKNRITATNFLKENGWSKKSDLGEEYQFWVQEDGIVPTPVLELDAVFAKRLDEEEAAHHEEGHNHSGTNPPSTP